MHVFGSRYYNLPFYISVVVNGLVLGNCMLDSGALTNIIPYGVMKQLGLKITR